MYTSECDIDLIKTPPRGYRDNTRAEGFFSPPPPLQIILMSILSDMAEMVQITH